MAGIGLGWSSFFFGGGGGDTPDTKKNKFWSSCPKSSLLGMPRFFLEYNALPIGSIYIYTYIHMTGIFTYIRLMFMGNVGKYTIRGSYGL